MPSFPMFVVYVLATWRISRMLVASDGHAEDGPFDILDKLRALSNRIGLGGLFACIWCMSVWVGLALAFLRHVNPALADTFAFAFTLSALAVSVQQLVNGYQSLASHINQK